MRDCADAKRRPSRLARSCRRSALLSEVGGWVDDCGGGPRVGLVGRRWTAALAMAVSILTGEQLAAITREMVRIKSRHYGRGATEGKTYQCDELVVCVLKGGLITAERDLLEHGDAALVRELRGRFQQNHRDAFEGAVERITGRRVLTYESQVLFDPGLHGGALRARRQSAA
jgi:uncharacterized protein YbcI